MEFEGPMTKGIELLKFESGGSFPLDVLVIQRNESLVSKRCTLQTVGTQFECPSKFDTGNKNQFSRLCAGKFISQLYFEFHEVLGLTFSYVFHPSIKVLLRREALISELYANSC